MYGPDRLMVNSAGDWGPSKPTAVPDFILAMRKRGHPESLIRKIVYENPLAFFSQSRNFRFRPRDGSPAVEFDEDRERAATRPALARAPR
jgi:uncharacterized protein